MSGWHLRRTMRARKRWIETAGRYRRSRKPWPMCRRCSKYTGCSPIDPARFDRHAGDFEVRAAHQLTDADEGAGGILAMEIAAIHRIECVVESQIRAVHRHRHQIVHREPGLA